MKRRVFLQVGFATGGGALLCASRAVTPPATRAHPPLRLRFHARKLELAPGIEVAAIACNGAATGPSLAVNAQDRVCIDVENDADRALAVRGPGLDRDLALSAGARARCVWTTSHSRVACLRSGMGETTLDAVSGVGGIFVRPDPTRTHDQEHHLTIHHWLPSLAAGTGATLGPGIRYRYATLGGRLLSASEPIRVRTGQWVRFHFINANASQCVTLRLPQHRFAVLALDGYAVPRPQSVEQLFLGPGERAEAVVHMMSPGRWILGSIDRRDREAGFGRIIEYAHARGVALAAPVEPPVWDYRAFAQATSATSGTGGDIPAAVVLFRPARPGATHPISHRLAVEPGVRNRLSLINASGERHCVSLRRQSFELTRVAGHETHGLVKDTLALAPFARTEIEFLAREPTVEVLHGSSVAVCPCPDIA